MSDLPQLRKGSEVYYFPEGDIAYSEARVAIIEDISINEQGIVASLAILSRGLWSYMEGIKHTDHLDLERHPHNRQRDGVFAERELAEMPAPKSSRPIPLYDETPVFNDSPAATKPPQEHKAPQEYKPPVALAPAVSIEEVKAAVCQVATQNEGWSSDQIYASFRGTKGLTKQLVTDVLIELQDQEQEVG